MRILITGVTGFVGSHLARSCLEDPEAVVTGLSLHAHWPPGFTDLASRVQVRSVDLCDYPAILEFLKDTTPDRVYHLAGYAEVGSSFHEADAAWRGNLEATRSLYQALAGWGGRCRVLYVSTGAVYGEPEDPEVPLDERSPLRPNSPYATSKAAADLLSYQYAVSHGLDIVRARPFNHVGPGQTPKFALPSFAWQLAAIEAGFRPPVLRVGNLWPLRDITDVRDVCHAYHLLLAAGHKGEVYNIASGESRSMQDHLDQLLALGKVAVKVEADPRLARRVETSAVRVDTARIRKATGWTPRYAMGDTLREMLEYCREHVRPESLSPLR